MPVVFTLSFGPQTRVAKLSRDFSVQGRNRGQCPSFVLVESSHCFPGAHAHACRPGSKTSTFVLLLSGTVLHCVLARAQSVSIASRSPELVLQAGTTTGMPRFAFSPDSRLLAAVSSQSELVVLWDPATGRQLRTLTTATDFTNGGIPGDTGDVRFSPDGKLLAVSKGGTIFCWDVETGSRRQPIRNRQLG